MRDPLDRLFDFYPAQARPVGPLQPIGNAGGYSGAKLWRFDSGLGSLVARRWPDDGPPPERLRTIHGWLARLTDLDFIPTPIVSLSGRTLASPDGAAWEIAPWMKGHADTSRPPAANHLRTGFGALAAVHQRLGLASNRGPSPGLIARIEETGQWMASGLGRLEEVVRGKPGDSTADLVLQWVGMARTGLPRLQARMARDVARIVPLQPVLRDARAEHLLFEGDRFTGIIDFGAMGIDSTAADLARLLSDWVGTDRAGRAMALDAYESIRGLEPDEVTLIDVFAESGAWLGPARWARWALLEGRTFEAPDAVRSGLVRTISRLEERLA